jgi:hypothetical protein
MAIGPNQLKENFMKEVDDFEKKIDQALSSKKVSPNSIVTVTKPSEMTLSHFQILKERYIKAGWGDVKLNDDQREGSWLTFDTKKSGITETFYCGS